VTARDGLQWAERRLRAAGVPEPGLDAELLLRHVLGWDRTQLLAHPERPLGAEDRLRLDTLVERRARREPIQHIVGVQAFFHHTFLTSPEALIPRPETELLVELSLGRLARVERPVVVDVGTGTGCIALSIATARPDAVVHATDISEPALRLARRNADRLGLRDSPRLRLHLGDLLEPVDEVEPHLVVCNPPYIGREERASLPPEVREHEPALALFPDGGRYGIYGRLVPAAAARLRCGGWLVLEVGFGMAGEVERLCRRAGLEEVECHPDLAGISRAVIARRPGTPP
jgi:release factor glutamine methyltransferase